jgi:hypothetical protein
MSINKPIHITTVWAELVPLTSHSESCASSLSWLPRGTQAVQHSESAKIPRSPSVAPRNLPPSRARVPTFTLPLPLGLLLCQQLFISVFRLGKREPPTSPTPIKLMSCRNRADLPESTPVTRASFASCSSRRGLLQQAWPPWVMSGNRHIQITKDGAL